MITLTKKQTVVSNKIMRSNRGFTLVELMVTLALVGIVIAAIFSVFTIQRKSYTAQEQVVEMQENIRASVGLMGRDLRMAGYDRSGTGTANAGIDVAVASGVAFSADFNEDGDVNDTGENIAYDLYNVVKVDGSSVTTLGRTSSNATIASGTPPDGGLFTGHQPIAENIEQIEFCYVLDDDNGWADNDNDCILAPTAAERDRVVALYLSILAVAAQRDAKFVSTATYISASGVDWTGTSPTDGFRRRFFSSKINLRNLGM